MLKRSLFLPSMLAVLALIALEAGCRTTADPPSDLTPTTRAQQIYQLYGERLALSAEIYEETMISAGEAHERGTLTDAQLAQIREMGGQVGRALELAKNALLVYVDLPEPGQASNLSARLLEFDRLLLQLADIARRQGVIQ